MHLDPVHEKKQGTNPFIICDNFLHDKTNIYIIGQSLTEEFLATLKSMDSCIRSLMNDERVDNFDYSKIEKCLNYLTSITVEKVESPELREFIDNYIHLAHNVNENTIKNDTIRKKISYLKRYADRSLTMSETMSLMRKCSLRMTRFKDFELPSYRLSAHYYTTIKEG